MNTTPTEYVWKYNPLSGIPAGAQQNYGATINWVLPGGTVMANVAEDLRASTLSPEQYSHLVTAFEAASDNQPYAGPRESNHIAAAVVSNGPPPSGLYPIELSGRQRVQLAGGRTEGRVQLSGGLTEGKAQLARGRNGRCFSHRPPRWCGARLSGNGVPDPAETTPDSFKYFLRTEGPSQVVDVPGTYTRREFMETFVPAVVKKPFASDQPGSFPAQYSALYKGRTAFEDTFWDW